MKENTEIIALLHLIDDPDEDVYSTVSERIISLGRGIIPNLEHLWENISNGETQERIEMLIHRVHFRDLETEFTSWKDGLSDLLDGTLLVSKYNFPDWDPSTTRQQIEKIRRNIWLELNSYLTPLEQVNVMNSIFYNYYKQQSTEIAYNNTDHFLINRALELRKGNAISNGIIYLVFCELLDIPVRAINIPRQFILAYFDEQHDVSNPKGHYSEKIKFYIDGVNGQMYSHKDIENYFKRMSVPPVSSYFRPMTNRGVIRYQLEELAKCFDNPANKYKMDELLLLASLLEP